MVELVLRGQYSHIDKYKHLYISLINDEYPETKEKLNRYVEKYTSSDHNRFPFDDVQIKIKLPQGIDESTLSEFEGRRVTVRVKPLTYQFISKFDYNKGERVKGLKLTLKDIQRCE